MTTLRIVLIGVAVAIATPAFAQEAVIEGPGYRVSDGTVIHPSLGLETAVVSNVFYEDADPVVSPVLRLLANLAIATLPPERLDGRSRGEAESAGLVVSDEEESNPGVPQKLEFRAGLGLEYHEYLTGNEAARAQRDLGIGLDLGLKANASGNVQFGLDELFRRDTRPVNFESTSNLNRDINRVKLGLTWRPRGGALWGTLAYSNHLELFEAEESRFANRIQHKFGLDLNWQWLPITRIFFETSGGIYGPLGSEAEAYKSDSFPLRVQAGIATALSEVTTLRVRAGYGNGFYSEGDNFNSFLAMAEFGYRYSPLGRFVIAYVHDFDDSVNANYYSDHALVIREDQQLGPILLHGNVSARLRAYRGIPAAFGDPSRDDLILSALVRGRYYMKQRFAFTAQYHLLVDSTDYVDMSGLGTDDPSFVRHELSIGALAAF